MIASNRADRDAADGVKELRQNSNRLVTEQSSRTRSLTREKLTGEPRLPDDPVNTSRAVRATPIIAYLRVRARSLTLCACFSRENGTPTIPTVRERDELIYLLTFLTILATQRTCIRYFMHI